MVGADELVRSSNAALADPDVRAKVREMHAAGTPLLDMVDQLGLTANMSPEVRTVLGGLSPDEVQGIRDVMVQMLDDDKAVMPIDCGVANVELPNGVDIGVVQSAGTPTIQIRAS